MNTDKNIKKVIPAGPFGCDDQIEENNKSLAEKPAKGGNPVKERRPIVSPAEGQMATLPSPAKESKELVL
jgi:hypothetical protein